MNATINLISGNLVYHKYKEGNNRPKSVYQIPLVHNHDKSGNKCYTKDSGKTQVWEWLSGKSKLLLLWPRTRRGIKSITSHISGGQIRRMQHTRTDAQGMKQPSVIRQIKHHHSINTIRIKLRTIWYIILCVFIPHLQKKQQLENCPCPLYVWGT